MADAVVELTVRAAADRVERTVVRIDAANGRLELDRSASSLAEGLDTVPLGGPVPIGDDGRVELRVLLDRSAIEVFANGRSLTARIYPTRADATGLSISSLAGAVRLERLEVWAMASVWHGPRPLRPLAAPHAPCAQALSRHPSPRNVAHNTTGGWHGNRARPRRRAAAAGRNSRGGDRRVPARRADRRADRGVPPRCRLNAHTWDPLLEHFAGAAIALDLPGHGDSSWRDDVDYSPATNAIAIAAALDTLLSAPAILVGHSLGGLTAIALQRLRPDLVNALVLVEALPFGPDDFAGIPVQARDFMDGPADYPSLDAIVDRAIAFGFGPSREAIRRSVESNIRVRDDGRVEWKYHWAKVDPTAVFRGDYRDLWGALQQVTVPVTLVAGEHGLITPALLRELAHRAPAVAARRLPTGHNVQEEDPGTLAAIVTEVTDAAQRIVSGGT